MFFQPPNQISQLSVMCRLVLSFVSSSFFFWMNTGDHVGRVSSLCLPGFQQRQIYLVQLYVVPGHSWGQALGCAVLAVYVFPSSNLRTHWESSQTKGL